MCWFESSLPLDTRRKLIHCNHFLQLVYCNSWQNFIHCNHLLQFVYCNSWRKKSLNESFGLPTRGIWLRIWEPCTFKMLMQISSKKNVQAPSKLAIRIPKVFSVQLNWVAQILGHYWRKHTSSIHLYIV